MSNPWSPFYWRDYIADTGHLSLAEHGAYLMLLSHYYMTGAPLPANAEQLHRVCRAFADAERAACNSVLEQFFVLEGDAYHNARADKELAKSRNISEVRSNAAKSRHANAPANAVQLHTQPQPQSQKQKSKAYAHPTLEEVTVYCHERGNQVDPEHFFNYYERQGWLLSNGRKMKKWKAAIVTWEKNGFTKPATWRNGDVPKEKGVCTKHPDSGLTNWGSCWACYSEEYGGELPAA